MKKQSFKISCYIPFKAPAGCLHQTFFWELVVEEVKVEVGVSGVVEGGDDVGRTLSGSIETKMHVSWKAKNSENYENFREILFWEK